MQTARCCSLWGLLLMALTSGCALPATNHTVGWHFEMGTPATMTSPVVVEQTSGPLAVGGVASGATAPAITQPRAAYTFASAPECQPPAPAVTAALAPRGSCTLDDLCTRLERIESKLNSRPTAAEMAPMPRGPAN